MATSETRSAADERELVSTARKRFQRAMDAEAKNRTAALDDLRFKNGDQWDEYARAKRAGSDGKPSRPCLTINKMPTFVNQITNDQRQNRPAINVSPLGDKGDKHTAQMLRGLIREIERHSDADIAYDTAFDNAVSNGFGYWRVITECEDEDSFDQVIRILRIRNCFSVYLDCDRLQPDASDAMWGFIATKVQRDEFKQKWPKADQMAWDIAGIGDDMKDWCDEKTIRVAEYFDVVITMRRLVYLQSGHIGFYDDLADSIKAQIDADPDFIIKERESECRQIKWYTITGKQILDEEDWAGKWIPIIECIGNEIDIEGKVYKSGVIRGAKDSQRMKNYWATAKTERVALESKAPWLVVEGQLEGHEEEWRGSGENPPIYLTYRPTSSDGKPAPPPQRQQWGGPPMSVIEAERDAEQDMMATTGIRFDATKSERIQDESGVALKQLKGNQQLGAYHYLDNLGRALKHTGRIMIDLIPHIYDTKRILTIINEDGSDEQVAIDPQQATPFEHADQGDGKKIRSFNPKVGRYEVAVTIGPNYETRMQEASASMMEFGKAFPQAAQFIGDLVAKNQPWPESDIIARRIASTLPPEMNQPEQKDLTPQVQAFIVSLQKKIQTDQQQLKQMGEALTEKGTQHALEKEKIDRDFEAKMTKIAADMEGKMAGLVDGRDGRIMQHMNDKFEMIFNAVRQLEMQKQQAQQPQPTAQAGAE